MHKINLHVQPVPPGHLSYCETQKTMNRNINFLESYWVARKKSFSCEKTEPQTAMIIWFVVLQFALLS